MIPRSTGQCALMLGYRECIKASHMTGYVQTCLDNKCNRYMRDNCSYYIEIRIFVFGVTPTTPLLVVRLEAKS